MDGNPPILNQLYSEMNLLLPITELHATGQEELVSEMADFHPFRFWNLTNLE